MVHGKEKRCVDCHKILTGHGTPLRCAHCAARKRYIDIHGTPPERIIAKCGVCEKEFSDYATNRKKSKDGILFCSHECRAIWTGIKNSITNGGDGLGKSKSDKDKIYYRRTSEKIREQRKEFYAKNRERILLQKRLESRDRKKIVIDHYGGKCECCGENILEFLTIDHINNDGASHRRELKGKGIKVYKDIIKNNFPKGRFRVLCFNCNITRGFYGYCPHKPNDKFEYSKKPLNPGRKRVVK